MAEVAQAYVSLAFSARGAQGDITKELAGGGAKGGKAAAKGFRGSFLPGVKSVIGGLGAAFAAAKVIDFFKGSVAEARESQKVGAITAQVIKSTGGAANVTAKAVGNLATRISNKTGIDDEAVQSASNLLLTFRNLRNETGKGNDVFNQATQTATDMGAALGKEPKAAAIQLGKALNDPIKGITSLGRAGVQFTEGQKKQIATMVKSGNILGAQKMILGELKSEFGGTAAASATAGEKAKVAWENLKEQLGTVLLPIIDRVEKVFTTKVIPAVSKFITQMQSGKGAGGQFAANLRSIGSAAASVGGFLNQHRTVVAALVAAYLVYRGTLAAVAVAQKVAAAAEAVGMAVESAHNAVRAASTSLIATWIGVKALELAAWVRSKAVIVADTAALVAHKAVSLAVAAATKTWAAVQWLLNAAMTANPIGLIIAGVALLIAGIVLAYKHSSKFRAAVAVLGSVLKAVGSFIGRVFVAYLKSLWGILKSVGGFIGKVFVAYLRTMSKAWLSVGIFGVRALRFLLNTALKVFGGIVKAAAKGLGWIPGLGPKIRKAANGFDDFRRRTVGHLDKVEAKLRAVRDGIGGIKSSKSVHISVTTSYREIGSRRAVERAQGAAVRAAILNARALGGPVTKGRMYLVGENGPELFTATRTGTIVPPSQAARSVTTAEAGPAKGQRVALLVGDRVFDAYMTEVADARIRAHKAHDATRGRQR